MENQKILAEPTRLAKIVDNWRNNVRGVDVAIDQVHDPDRGAAGWVRDLKIGPSTTNPGRQALFAKVEWTPLGQELVGGGIFRYMSAEFGHHKDAETGAEYPDVLYASTLTNRPFVKGLAPVTLESEWIEVLREGDYLHGVYGQLSIQADEADWLRRLYRFLESRLKAGEPVVPSEALEAAETVAFATQGDESDKPTDKEIRDMEKLIAYLKELGIELAEGADPVDALREHLDKQKATVATLSETQTAMAEEKSKRVQLEKDVAALTAKLEEGERSGFLDEMTRQGKLLPAERKHFEELYKTSKDTVRSLLGERAPKVDLEEHGVSTTETVPVEDRRLAKMEELITGGMNPAAAYTQAHRDVQ